jgi:hypothetical protein
LMIFALISTSTAPRISVVWVPDLCSSSSIDPLVFIGIDSDRNTPLNGSFRTWFSWWDGIAKIRWDNVAKKVRQSKFCLRWPSKNQNFQNRLKSSRL